MTFTKTNIGNHLNNLDQIDKKSSHVLPFCKNQTQLKNLRKSAKSAGKKTPKNLPQISQITQIMLPSKIFLTETSFIFRMLLPRSLKVHNDLII